MISKGCLVKCTLPRERGVYLVLSDPYVAVRGSQAVKVLSSEGAQLAFFTQHLEVISRN